VLMRRTWKVMVPYLVSLVLLAVAIARLHPVGASSITEWMLLSALAVVVVSQMMAAKSLWRTYRIALGPNIVRVVQRGFQPQEALRSEVAAIADTRDLMLLRTSDGSVLFPLRGDVADQADLRARLAAWCPIEAGKHALAAGRAGWKQMRHARLVEVRDDSLRHEIEAVRTAAPTPSTPWQFRLALPSLPRVGRRSGRRAVVAVILVLAFVAVYKLIPRQHPDRDDAATHRD
jgi:hypothetical protein